jgi:L-fuculose-phosphate aldolase
MKGQDIRTELIEVCRWLAQRAFVAADDGSVSAKVAPDQIVITPRGRSLGRVTPDQLVQCNLGQEKLSGEAEPSPALRLHLTAYIQRTEITAAIQAQPPATTAFAVAGIPLVQPVLPETVLTLGSVPMVSYATPFTEEAAQAIGESILGHDALLLKNRGILTVGLDLADSLQKLERVEQLASILLAAKSLDHIDILSGNQVNKLLALREDLKLRGINPWVSAHREKKNG